MNQPVLNGKKKVKRLDNLKKPSLHLDNFPDLPIGIIVYQPVWDDTGTLHELAVTYCNPFAASLLGKAPTDKDPVLLTEIHGLRTLFKLACHVLETGVSAREEFYEPKKKCWIDSSIFRRADEGTIYIQTSGHRRIPDNPLQQSQDLESIISGISSTLGNLPSNEMDSYLVNSLAQLGRYTQSDRAYIFTYSMNGALNSCTHEWCAEGIEPQQAFFQDQVSMQFPWWHQKMMQQEIISLSHIDDLPTGAIEERKSLKKQSIQSLLAVPMVLDNRVVGYVGFDMVQQPRQWNQHDIDLLRIYSGLVVSATNRLADEKRLERVNKRLEGINRISTTLLNSHLLEEQADLAVLKHLYDMIPCEVGIVFRIDPSGQFAYTDNRMRRGVREFWPGVRFPASYLNNRKLSNGKFSLIRHLRPDTNGMPVAFNPYNWGHRSFLGVPLFAQQHYVGLLVLLDKMPDFFTDEHVLIAQEVADQLSILLLQEETNQKINQSNQLLQAVVDTIPVGLGLLKPIRQGDRIVDFSHLLTNENYSALTGSSQPVAERDFLLARYPNVQQTGLFDKLVEVAQTGQPHQLQLQNNTPDGALWSDVSIVRVGTMILFTARDITPLKYVEGQLRQTNAELEERVEERSAQIQRLSAMQQAILTYAGLAITATDMAGVVQLVNPALEAMSGYSADELVGKVTPSFIGQPRIFRSPADPEPISTYIEKHGYIQQENTIITKAGKSIPVLSTTSGLYDAQNNLTGYVNFVTNISYLKHIEKELINANQRIQLATTAGNLGVWEWNLLTNDLTLDKNFYAVFGLPTNIPMNKMSDLTPFIFLEDLAYFRENMGQIIQKNKPFDVEFRINSPADRSVHYMKADGIVLRDEVRQEHRIVGIVRDRTAQNRATKALRSSEKRYRLLVDYLKDIVFHIDTNGLLSYLNPSWQTVTGFSIAESVGQPFLSFVHPDDRDHNAVLCFQLLSRQKPRCEHIVRYIHKEGGYRWISVFAQVTLDEENEVTGVTGTLTDITERKQSEEALQESEQRFRDIAENVDEIFWIRALNEPRFTYMNSAYERFTGQSPKQLYKNPLLFLTFVLEEDRQKVLDAFTLLNSETDVRFRAKRQDGSTHWLEIRGFVVKDETGTVIRRIGMASNVTSAIEKELILEESLKNERNLNYLKSQFISTASHEFRTPLATISSSVELLKYHVNTGTGSSLPSINQQIDNIYREVYSLNNLVANTLTISKIEERKVVVKPELTNLVALCNKILNEHFSNRVDKRYTELVITGSPVSIIIDQNLLSHIITNLLTNAFKFSAKNPVLAIKFRKTLVQIQVIDKGIGIPAVDLPNLFGKFFRARNAATVQGTGLGLAICREYVTLMKGRINVESKEGIGTTVKVTIPSKNHYFPSNSGLF